MLQDAASNNLRNRSFNNRDKWILIERRSARLHRQSKPRTQPNKELRNRMPAITRRQLLESLRRDELLVLTQALLTAPCSRDAKIVLFARLEKSRTVRMIDMLESLPAKTVNRVCRSAGVKTGPTKVSSIARLLNDPLMEAGDAIRRSLKKQGFTVTAESVRPPTLDTKEKIRAVHQLSVEHKQDVARTQLQRRESELLNFIANGSEVEIDKISPRIEFVQSGSVGERLFRYATLHWSIPVSAGYGRRLRVLIFDNNNDKLIGLIGLCDPVFALRDRDEWIGWDSQQRQSKISQLVDAYVLGAVPPYNHLLFGKLVAMLANANEIRTEFRRKYATSTSLIRKDKHTGEIAAITTTSALGRSSIYNRLRYGDRKLFLPLGYTAGNGDFQFLNGAYEIIQDTIIDHGTPTAKNANWGTGYRNRREVVRNFLKATGIPPAALQHGIKRQVFISPLATNTQAVLNGTDANLEHYDQSVEQLWHFFRDRWLIPREHRLAGCRGFSREEWRLWPAP